MRIPVSISEESGLPFAEVEIEGEKYPVLVDLGSSLCLTLSEEIVNHIREKQPYRQRVITAFNGKSYPLESYIVSDVRLRNLVIGKLEVSKGSKDFLGEAGLIHKGEKEPEPRFGELGFGFFSMLNMPLFLDLSHGVIYIRASFNRLRKEGYHFENWTKVPFSIGPQFGVVLDLETDLGSKKLVLDTGATLSLLSRREVGEGKTESFHRSPCCKIGETDFGEQDFFLTQFPEVFGEIDGFLGMDFLKSHTVYLDFERKEAYFSKSI